MPTTHYYTYPFGQDADDLTSIPDSAAVDGSVSYQDGWTPPYEYNLLTNPAALPIPRGQMNQLFYDITLNIQEYQQYGTPQWVTGNTVEYPIYARVYYLGQVYENQLADNTATPGADSTWLVISSGSTGLPIGTVIDFAGPVVPTNFLNCDGSAVSRTTYAALLSVITQTQNGTLTNGLPSVTGLSDTSAMYAGMDIEGTNIPASTTILSVDSVSSITMSANATGSGSTAIQFFSWGSGNGTTTFNLPDQRRATKIGSGGSGTATIGNVTGQFGGEEAHTQTIAEMPAHDHPGSYIGGSSSENVGSFVERSDINNVNQPLIIASQGGGSAFNIMQPSNVFTQCIKYQ